MSLSVKELTTIGAKTLAEKGIMDADRDSKTLYCYMIGIPESKMISEYKYTVQDILCDKYFDLIDRRASGEPLQYIVGNTAFMGLPFKVEPGVLIPRQDTETLVELALSVINYDLIHGKKLNRARKSWDVLDIGTGSGAIGVSIAKLGHKCGVTMTDISKQALTIAKENARVNGVDKSVKILEGDLFRPVSGRFGNKKFDMIISNPPYIPTDDIGTLQTEIKDHEPLVALDGGQDGLDTYRRIAADVGSYLKKSGVLMLEIGDDQKDAVTAILKETKLFVEIQCFQDLAGRDRVLFAYMA